MCEIYMQSRSYPLFDGYELNTSKAITRYDKHNDKPLQCRIRTKEMKNCTCGGLLVSLAYRYDDGVEQSRVLLGKNVSVAEKTILQKKQYQCFLWDLILTILYLVMRQECLKQLKLNAVMFFMPI